MRYNAIRMTKGTLVVLFMAGMLSCTQDKATSQEETPVEGAASGNELPAKEIRITAIPDENPTELARQHALLSDYLETHLGTPVTFIPVTDYGAAVEALRSGKSDFAWLGGFTFVQARVLAGAVPLVMRGVDKKFQSVFIAHSESDIKTPEDLRGKTFAFGSKSSTSGHLMPRHFLSTTWKINPKTDFKGLPIYSGAHDATVKAVESGKVQAGALNIQVWKKMVASKGFDPSKIRVIWTTPEYVDYVWAASKSVPSEWTEKFTKAFTSLDAKNPKDQEILALQGAKTYEAASNDMFDPIEEVARSTGLLK